jgi:hypothetical protein
MARTFLQKSRPQTTCYFRQKVSLALRPVAKYHLPRCRGIFVQRMAKQPRALRTAWSWRLLRLPLVRGTQRQDEFFSAQAGSP